MGREHATRRPIRRLLAAALLSIVWTTAVHGATSATVPAGAIAAAHAPVGAALIHPGATASRDAGEAGPSGNVGRWTTEELLPPTGELLPAGTPATAARATLGTPSGADVRLTRGDSAARSRSVPGHPTRAPPHRDQAAGVAMPRG